MPRRIKTRAVGTGPFRFKSYKKDDGLRMEAHPAFWGQPQKTEQLIFAITREPNVRVQKIVAGECHVSAPLRDSDVAADGRVSMFNAQGSVDVFVDVNGYFVDHDHDVV